MSLILNKKGYFNKKIFYYSLLLSLFLNFLILIFFSTISKIVNPPKINNEPKIRFIELKKEEKIEIKPKKVKEQQVKLDKKEKVISGEKKAEQKVKKEIKPAQIQKGTKEIVKRENVINKPKNVLPPKTKKEITSKEKVENKKAKAVVKSKEEKVITKKTPNIIKNEKKIEKKLPPPPETPPIDNEYSLTPPKSPDLVGTGKDLSSIEKIEGIGEGNPSQLLKGVKTISPIRKELQFGKKLKEYEKGTEGTAKERILVYMPEPPVIKTKLALLPRSIKVKIWITPDGTVSNVLLLKKTGDPNLDMQIIEYIKSWKFNKIEGNETQWAITTVRFKTK